MAAILGRDCAAQPIETRQLKSIADCKPEWILRWSETLEQFGAGPGPLHTRSKRFANLKTSPAKIGAMLAEIGDYEELSSNRDQDWLLDAGEAADWLDDLWRVAAAEPGPGPDQLMPPDDTLAPAAPQFDQDLAQAVSLPLRYMELAWLAEDRASWTARCLDGQSLPVRLAVYLKMLGAFDDSYLASGSIRQRASCRPCSSWPRSTRSRCRPCANGATARWPPCWRQPH